ncbi:MAG: ABC-2 type transport system permease protein [Rickettsiales bacterium]|jgi:ABC-2 type transport system permease protein
MTTRKINYYGTYSLFKKEVLRFLKVYHQTIFSPIINALLLLAIFSLSLGNRVHNIGDVPFKEFMAAGLVIMVAMQNAFANSSSSLTMGKVMGHIIDYLIPPIGAGGILIAFAAAAVLRGILVGIIAYVAISFFVPMSPHHYFYALFCIVFASLFLGLLGMLCGILSDSFDQMSAITSYLITPLTFLSGTFYSTKNLPEFWQTIAHFNPFFYMIDGFRYGITGYSDGNILVGAITIFTCNVALIFVIHHLLKIGYRIKS